MLTLFPTTPDYPDGFEYYPDFLTEEEEREFMKAIAHIELQTFTFRGYAANRKVASFGVDWSFEHQRLTKGKAIPDVFNPLIEKVAMHLCIAVNAFAELLVTEYSIGSVINWHRDAPPFELIAGVSLLSDCTFHLRPYEKAKQGRSAIRSFPVQRGSLYLMQGPARRDWQHSIMAVKPVRYSITLRTLRKEWMNKR